MEESQADNGESVHGNRNNTGRRIDGDQSGVKQVTAAELQKLLQLHPTDAPGLALVTKLLTENNFQSWSQAMRFALGAKKKLRFVQGAVPKPDEDSPEYEQWLDVDMMVTSWI
jgi:hypothetical protein